jgi:transglutaminase-like putative cysteine protease
MTSSTIKQKPSLKRLWASFDALPAHQVEDSMILRILVQTLVIIGILATDVASGRQMSIWAIPLSVIGGLWSWRQRRKRNIMVKFLLAIGMILVLFLFFGNLIESLNDTRLVLAELLIQLQVLHSFDLPRRKDLGYSMVIGLILLGVAGTVSQTLSFAPLLFLFLVVALPTLSLDYHSRLGIKPEKSEQKLEIKIKGKDYRKFAYLILTICTLGLLIFALMPRFSGYQLRSFPVDSPEGFKNRQFDLENSVVINPGLEEWEEGKTTEQGRGRNSSPERGPGEVDMEFYYGFSNKMNQNLRGNMTPKLLMRIRSQARGFWRMLAFDQYNGQGWEISREDQTMNITRPHWSYRFSLPLSSSLGKTKSIVQTYSMVSDLPNIIPTLSYATQLFFPTREIALDLEGGLRSPFYLMKGLTYTVISEVPYRDLARQALRERSLLRETSQIYPPEITKYHLQIPPAIKDKVKTRALALLAKSPKPITSNYEKALYLAQSLKQEYTIQSDLPFFEEGEDLVDAFLFRYQGGYPDHFATVFTIMLRSLDIPARLTVGFAPGNFNPFTGYYLVYNTDAHALTEVYFPTQGWFTFDPIPGHDIVPPSFEEDDTFGVLKAIWRQVAGWLPSPVTAFLKNFFEAVFGGLYRLTIRLWGWVSSSIIGFLIGILSLVLLSFLAWLGIDQLQSWRKRRYLSKLAPMERLYRQMLNLLQERGYPKHPAQTPLEYAAIAKDYQQPAIAEIIEEISQAYVKWRYGGYTQDLSYLSEQFKLLKTQK